MHLNRERESLLSQVPGTVSDTGMEWTWEPLGRM
jgi:hypothetical protein